MTEPYPNEIAGFPALSAQPTDSDEKSAGRPALVFLHSSFTTHTSFANYLSFFSEAGFEQTTHMRRTVAYPKLSSDHFGYPRTRPYISAETVRLGSPLQKLGPFGTLLLA